MRKHLTAIKQRKSLGQVFLNDDWPCEKMAQQLYEAGVEKVIEIGPGPGILTKQLLKRGISVLAIEKDPRFADYVSAQVQTDPEQKAKLEIINKDVLEFNLKEWVNSDSSCKAVCGNVPYNISSSLVFWLLPQLKRIKCASFMVQLEFAERLAAKPHTKSYGSLSVFTQLRSKAKLEFKVSRSCFTPVPKVDSAVLSLTPTSEDYPQKALKDVEKVTRRAFSQRRKKLSNSMKAFLSGTDTENLPIDLNRRCDTLTPKEFVQLAEAIFPENEV